MSRHLFPLSLTATLMAGTALADVPQVAVDIAPVHSLVVRVMQGVGEPSLVIPPGASPHEYSLRPSEAAALQNADLVFWIGEDLTPWMADAVETLADDADVTTLLEADDVMLLDFREDALFEAHSHGHDEHTAGHDHAHGHGEHAFEWAGLFDLEAGNYSWSFAKVDGDYADPAMRMVILSGDEIEAVEEVAEGLLQAEAADERHGGDVLVAAETAYTLTFDGESEMTVFEVAVAEAGTYAFFTEHMPFEFEADEHFFKDAAGADVEPIAQEPDMGHDHGHGYEEHGHKEHDHDDHGHDDHGHDDHGHDHAAGHDHGAHDPHAWLSPDNAAVWLSVIAAELSTADPDNAGTYFANAAAAREELEIVASEVNEILDPVRGLRFIVFHDAYQYFETAFDFPASGAISIGDAADPSPARIAKIQGRVADENIQCVLSEPQFNPGLVATVMDGTEANTAVLDPIGSNLEPGPALYPQLLRNLASALASCR